MQKIKDKIIELWTTIKAECCDLLDDYGAWAIPLALLMFITMFCL